MTTPQPVALVTGASRGIGRAIAGELAAGGFAVVVNYLRSAEAAESLVRELQQAGGQASAVAADVGSGQGRQLLIEHCRQNYGRLDLLVNNAGITSQGRRDLLEATEESWDLVFETNLKGPFFLAQMAARLMIQCLAEQRITRGLIINVSSISAYAASTNRADYCMAKAALEMMTWLLADRLAEEKIRVYEVCPGVIASDMTAPVTAKYDQLISEGLTPIRRWGQPLDVAKVVRWLTDPCLDFCTGQRMHVDGGFHIRRL